MSTKFIKCIVLFLFSSSLILNGQEEASTFKEYETLSRNSNTKTKVSGFGNLSIDLGGLHKKLSIQLGIDGALLINRSFYIGLYGRGMVSFPRYEFQYYDVDSLRNQPVTANGALYHGGLIIGGEFFAHKPFHFGLSAKFGGGGFGVGYEKVNVNPEHNANNSWDDARWRYGVRHLMTLFVFTPQADFIMNITPWFKIKVGIGYQWVSDGSVHYTEMVNGDLVERELVNAANFRSAIGSLGLCFGGFK